MLPETSIRPLEENDLDYITAQTFSADAFVISLAAITGLGGFGNLASTIASPSSNTWQLT
jgi:hypothetical protein